MTGRRSRTKGHAWERYVARFLRPLWPEAKRGWQQRDGAEQCDVEGTPYWIECKRMKRVNVQGALTQALNDTDGRPVVLIWKDDHGQPWVAMELAQWAEDRGLAWVPEKQLQTDNS